MTMMMKTTVVCRFAVADTARFWLATGDSRSPPDNVYASSHFAHCPTFQGFSTISMNFAQPICRSLIFGIRTF